MSTYAENAAARERKERKAAQDQHMAGLHSRFDAEAAAATDKRGQHKTMKYERPSFTVVTTSEAFRVGYDQINWGRNAKPGTVSMGEPSVARPVG